LPPLFHGHIPKIVFSSAKASFYYDCICFSTVFCALKHKNCFLP
jgi:hypothetical protein